MNNIKNGDPILEMIDITKIYPNGVIANDHISLVCKKGEIHALLGENGAGKSTLMKILFGIEEPTKGHIKVNGDVLHIKNSMTAIEHGIGMVHQHFMLVNELSVAENLVLGKEPKSGILYNKEQALEITRKLVEEYNFNLNPESRVGDLSVGSKQKLEILKALFRGADILILDEPTAVLTPQETVLLFESLHNLRAKGHTIIFISHKLDEVIQLCENYTILRHGQVVHTGAIQDTTPNDLSRMMVGKVMKSRMRSTPEERFNEIISLQHTSYQDKDGVELLKDVSLNLRKKTITGIVGVEGNGQDELSNCIIGSIIPNSGDVLFEGSSLKNKSIRERRNMGIACISEDRMRYGFAQGSKIYENLISNKILDKGFGKKGFLDMKSIMELSQTLIQRFSIACTGPEGIIDELSGGNIQKVVVARELSDGKKYIIANQPTRGVDVGSAEFIREKLVEATQVSDVGILLISADLNEILSMSDEIYVMYNGRIVAYFQDVETVTEEIIGEYMLGLKKMSGGDNREI